MSLRDPILLVRMGAMGDIIHALPSAASLKQSFPHSLLVWAVEERWVPLLEGNPFVDRFAVIRRESLRELLDSARRLRRLRPRLAVDLQGLIKSALTASIARSDRIVGFAASELREKPAAWFYSHTHATTAAHVVDKNLQLVQAAGATSIVHRFHIPPGAPEGVLPAGGFVLANPFGGWPSKQWPLAHYSELGKLLRRDCGLTLVLNAPAEVQVEHTHAHVSGLRGLIDATRRAAAVVGIDSGPMHLAAALQKPGVAIFGPTDPERNGPYGDSFSLLRSPGAVTSYKRNQTQDAAMARITPAEVFASLTARIYSRSSA